MKVHVYRVGSRRLRATPRLGTKKRSVKRLKRPWAPYKHRDLFLYLFGFTLVSVCITPIPLYYWYRAQAERHFAIEAARGQPALAQVEAVEDHGRSVLTPNSAYE